METRYLESLIAVVESGSIAEAARSQGLTAAALGQRVRALEQDFGCLLLIRNGHVAKPSLACLRLLDRARQIVQEVANLRGDLDPLGLSGTLRIGAISTALTGLLPQALQRLTANAPSIRPVIVPGTSRELYKQLRSGELDAAVVVRPPFPLVGTVDAETLRREPLAFVAHEQLQGSPQTLLTSQPYIRYDPESWGGMLALSYLREQGIDSTVLYDLDGLEAIAMLVADKVGVSLLPCWPGLERLATDCRIVKLDSAYDREIVLLIHADPERLRMLDALKAALGLAPAATPRQPLA